MNSFVIYAGFTKATLFRLHGCGLKHFVISKAICHVCVSHQESDTQIHRLHSKELYWHGKTDVYIDKAGVKDNKTEDGIRDIIGGGTAF